MALSLATNIASGLTIEAALDDPYRARQVWSEGVLGHTMMYIAVLLAAANFPLVSTTVAFWRHARPVLRIPALVLLVSAAVYSVQGASRHGVFAYLVVASTAAGAAIVGNRLRLRLRTFLFVLGAAFFAFAVYSSFLIRNLVRLTGDEDLYRLSYFESLGGSNPSLLVGELSRVDLHASRESPCCGRSGTMFSTATGLRRESGLRRSRRWLSGPT